LEVISRQEAKKLGLKRYFTGRACIHGHIAERQTTNKRCLECARLTNIEQKEYKARWYIEKRQNTESYGDWIQKKKNAERRKLKYQMYMNLFNRKYKNKICRKYYNSNRVKLIERSKNDVDNLTDTYIKHLLAQCTEGISRKDITSEMIADKRKEIQIKRIIAKYKKKELSHEPRSKSKQI
jgi:hypothetical protein